MDSWYVLQVSTGREPDVSDMLCRCGIQAIAPAVARHERKDGHSMVAIRRAIPGYVFVRCKMTVELYYHLARKPGVIKLLGQDCERFTAIPPEQIKWIEQLHAACGGGTDKTSRGTIAEDGSLVVLDGALVALQDRITKVDVRRRRVTIAIELYDDIYEVDLGIEIIDKHPDGTAG